MSEAPYSPLPYMTMLNKATPSSPYHIDAAGLKANFEGLAAGTALQDESITIRTISPELMVLLNLSIMATVQTWELLPAAEDIEAGKCYIVTDSIEDHPGGIYQSDGIETWTMLYNWVNTFTELIDCPNNYLDEGTKLVGVKITEDGLEFVNIEAGSNVVLTKTAGNIKIDAAKPNFIIDLPAGSWKADVATEQVSGTNVKIDVDNLDDAYANKLRTVFQLPADIGTGNVTFEVWGFSRTAASSKKIALTASYKAASDSESFDQSYSTKASGDLAVDGTQDDLDYFTWTETISNLGSASELVNLMLSRSAPSETNLSGHWALVHFRITIPRA